MTVAKGLRGRWPSGARLPAGPSTSTSLGCWRCDEDRRILRDYNVSRSGQTIAHMRLCDSCAGELLPLDPDPLDVQPA